MLAPRLCWGCGGPARRGEPLCRHCRLGLRRLPAEPVPLAGVPVWAPVAYEGAARDSCARSSSGPRRASRTRWRLRSSLRRPPGCWSAERSCRCRSTRAGAAAVASTRRVCWPSAWQREPASRCPTASFAGAAVPRRSGGVARSVAPGRQAPSSRARRRLRGRSWSTTWPLPAPPLPPAHAPFAPRARSRSWRWRSRAPQAGESWTTIG